MGGFNKNVIFIFPALIGAVFSLESCSIDTAAASLASRTEQYGRHLNDPKDMTLAKEICLTQINPDKTEADFENAIKLCTNAEVDIIQQTWVDINRNITDTCQQDCPDILQLPTCKNMTYLDEIEFNRYERFCNTFNTSMRCALQATSDCTFGPTLYTALLEPIVQQYWRYICNSGCSNIDDTVASITQCLAPLKNSKKSELCMAHYVFKDCVRGKKNLCPEVLKLVRFIYRKYDAVDKHCTTTTTVTTTPLPETTTPMTETPEVTDIVTKGTSTVTKNNTETPDVYNSDATIQTKRFEQPTKNYGVTANDVFVRIEDCLSSEDLQVISAGEINFNSVVVYLKLESCLHNTSTDSYTIDMIRESFPSNVQSFHSHVKLEAWRITEQVLLQSVQCKENKDDKEGCSGHQYGLIPCNSVSIPVVNYITVSLCLVLTTMSLNGKY